VVERVLAKDEAGVRFSLSAPPAKETRRVSFALRGGADRESAFALSVENRKAKLLPVFFIIVHVGKPYFLRQQWINLFILGIKDMRIIQCVEEKPCE
jgi:hypothetical protein